jgi:hypothetical protein
MLVLCVLNLVLTSFRRGVLYIGGRRSSMNALASVVIGRLKSATPNDLIHAILIGSLIGCCYPHADVIVYLHLRRRQPFTFGYAGCAGTSS